ncbi:MAG: hypothetical protein N2652_07785 [Kiritimatiellae bacterium]|nr:hypothetical protein [Kiritimatiellia bacterium]
MKPHRGPLLSAMLALTAAAAGNDTICISGIRPHLAVFNPYGECGIGAVVPWAGRLWWITYPPHYRTGSEDGLYSTDESFRLVRHPESVGGTHAARLIHRESRQLFLGPYAIDATGRVRAIDVKAVPGRYTAWARHLTDPENRLLLFDMEGPIWEVNVHTLEARKLFEKPVPGWHGKGAWTGQGRFIIANNGEHAAGRTPRSDEFLCPLPPPSPEDAGALAEWDGTNWRLIARRQFCEVAGPGGLHGATGAGEPVWATGWDRRSVLLYLLDQGRWSCFRLPKGSFTYDPRHGWFTEWPRIREIGRGRWMMTMHGQMFDFPPTFCSRRTAGLRPIATHLRYIPDFCEWNGRLVLASDDCSVMQNPLAGKSQSNLWIGSPEDLPSFGPPIGWGGVWLGDAVKGGAPSDPYLFAGYRRRCAHLAHNAGVAVGFRFEVDVDGDGRWVQLTNVVVSAGGYAWLTFPADAPGEWIRVIADRDLTAGSVYFHYLPDRPHAPDERRFAALAPATTAGRQTPWCRAILRPGDGVLHVLAETIEADGRIARTDTLEVHADLSVRPSSDPAARRLLETTNAIRPDFATDAASVIVTDAAGRRWRLPRGPAAPDRFAPDSLRGVRECVSERYLANFAGILYEIPRTDTKATPNYREMKPIAAHGYAISDFCTWRGLMVLAGCRTDPPPDGHVLHDARTGLVLWLGQIDELWKLGKPVGRGGPWHETAVQAGVASDPYLMTGFDRKTLTIRHAAGAPVRVRIEVDYSNRDFWKLYRELIVPPGSAHTHEFPADFSAHWVRLVSDTDCTMTATFEYR